jgi:hypothetical protein
MIVQIVNLMQNKAILFRRTLTHDKSSHGLWPGELKNKRQGMSTNKLQHR